IAVGNAHVHLAKPRARVARVLARADVELKAVPGADNVHSRLRERHALAGLVVSDDFLDFSQHLALTGGTAHVRTLIEVGEKLSVELEHRHFEPVEADDLPSWIAELGY